MLKKTVSAKKTVSKTGMAPPTEFEKKVQKIATEVEAVKMGSGHGIAGRHPNPVLL